MNNTTTNNVDIFKAGENCWRQETAGHASLVVDCANYYRELHQAICKAKHSIFITGWDIDSRIHLLRGEDAAASKCAVTLFELIVQRATDNPDMQIYLNRWDYALFMAKSREPMSAHKWASANLCNIHFCRDGKVPFGACHHQKVIVIDDETAFCGGMDIAIERWDKREHFPQDAKRSDPGGIYDGHDHHSYGPYHDIQSIVSGDAAMALAILSRDRWKIATGEDAIPLRKMDSSALPPSWPESDPHHFEGIRVSIARTLPEMKNQTGVFEIEQAYIDQIAVAEKFIYMENQYFTRECIAEAIQKRLVEIPGLKVLMVSSYDPQNPAERMAMWTGRIRFKEIVLAGVEDRVIMAYPLSRVETVEKTIRIHSKVMIVDDKFLHVGSANINNRSMRCDTECDLIFQAVNDDHRTKITELRNDLIREHSGREVIDIQNIIDSTSPIQKLIEEVGGSRQHLREINDEKYAFDYIGELSIPFADPGKERETSQSMQSSGRITLKTVSIVLGAMSAIALLLFLWNETALADFMTPENLSALMNEYRQSPLFIPAAIGLFAIATLLFAPMTILTAAFAVALGPLDGILISMVGSLLSAAIGFMIGSYLKPDNYGPSNSALEKIRENLKDNGIPAVVFLRLLPVAPFTVVNFSIGMLHVPFWTFMAGSFLGLLPGKVVLGLMGGSLSTLWENRDWESLVPILIALIVWMGVVATVNNFYKRWHKQPKAA